MQIENQRSLVGKEEKQATQDVVAVTNNVIESVNENLHSANLVAETTHGFLLNVKQLELQWKKVVEERT